MFSSSLSTFSAFSSSDSSDLMVLKIAISVWQLGVRRCDERKCFENCKWRKLGECGSVLAFNAAARGRTLHVIKDGCFICIFFVLFQDLRVTRESI